MASFRRMSTTQGASSADPTIMEKSDMTGRHISSAHTTNDRPDRPLRRMANGGRNLPQQLSSSGWSGVDPTISSMYSFDASHSAQAARDYREVAVRRGSRRCETFCNKARKTLLADNSHCAATVKQYVLIPYGGLSQLFNACVEGREKALDRPAVLESRRDNFVHRGMQGQLHCFVVQEGELPCQRVASFYLPPHHLLINFPAGNSRAMIQCFELSKITSASVRTISPRLIIPATTTTGMMSRKKMMVSAALSRRSLRL